MTESTNNGMIQDQLPKGLQQAVTATNQLVPDEASESRVIAAAMSISTSHKRDAIGAESVYDNHSPTTRQKFQWRLLLATLALPAALCLMCLLIPCNFEVQANGTLHPKERCDVFVEENGTVVEIPKGLDHGSIVEKGDTLLILQNVELDSQIESTTDELQDGVNEQETRTLEKTLARLTKQREALTVKSPVQGQILKFQLRRNLMNRPLNRGDKLMTIANLDSEWEIEIDLPEDQIAQITASYPKEIESYPVTYVLKSDPKTKITGKLLRKNFRDSMQLDETTTVPTVRMTIEFDEEEWKRRGKELLRPGAEAVVYVNCGQLPVGYVWLHKLIEFAQTNLFF